MGLFIHPKSLTYLPLIIPMLTSIPIAGKPRENKIKFLALYFNFFQKLNKIKFVRNDVLVP